MEEKKTGSRGKLIREVAWLEGIILVILIGFSAILIVGQIHANQSITNAGRAIQEAAAGSAGSAVEYRAAIEYMEAAQQAYSESGASKLISLIYTILATVILGYGAKMFLLSADEREKLVNEIIKKTDAQMKEAVTSAEEELKKSVDSARQDFSEFRKELDQYRGEIRNEINQRFLLQEISLITASSCRNVANLSLLLQIRLVKSAEADNSPEEVVPLHRNLIAYLERLSGSLDMWLKKDPDRTTSWEQRGALEETWKTAVFSLSGYLNPNGNIEESPCFRLFGQRDHSIIMKLYQEIDKQITALIKEAA